MTRILKSLRYGGMQSSVDEKQYEYAYTLLGPCTSTIAQVCTKKSTLLLPLSSTFSGIWSQAKKLYVFSLVCIVFKSRSLLRRGNPKFDLENLRSSFFRGSVEETTTFNYLEAQKREGKRIVLHTHILLQTENSTEETWLFVAVVSINHQRWESPSSECQ